MEAGGGWRKEPPPMQTTVDRCNVLPFLLRTFKNSSFNCRFYSSVVSKKKYPWDSATPLANKDVSHPENSVPGKYTIACKHFGGNNNGERHETKAQIVWHTKIKNAQKFKKQRGK